MYSAYTASPRQRRKPRAVKTNILSGAGGCVGTLRGPWITHDGLQRAYYPHVMAGSMWTGNQASRKMGPHRVDYEAAARLGKSRDGNRVPVARERRSKRAGR